MIDSAPYLHDRIKSVLEELDGRIGEMSEADWLAVCTAVCKASLGGFREGVADIATSLQRQGVTLTLSEFIRDEERWPDWWLEAGHGTHEACT